MSRRCSLPYVESLSSCLVGTNNRASATALDTYRDAYNAPYGGHVEEVTLEHVWRGDEGGGGPGRQVPHAGKGSASLTLRRR